MQLIAVRSTVSDEREDQVSPETQQLVSRLKRNRRARRGFSFLRCLRSTPWLNQVELKAGSVGRWRRRPWLESFTERNRKQHETWTSLDDGKAMKEVKSGRTCSSTAYHATGKRVHYCDSKLKAERTNGAPNDLRCVVKNLAIEPVKSAPESKAHHRPLLTVAGGGILSALTKPIDGPKVATLSHPRVPVGFKRRTRENKWKRSRTSSSSSTARFASTSAVFSFRRASELCSPNGRPSQAFVDLFHFYFSRFASK